MPGAGTIRESRGQQQEPSYRAQGDGGGGVTVWVGEIVGAGPRVPTGVLGRTAREQL